MSTPPPPQRNAAVALACPSDQVGSCARCYQPCHRYGYGGNPLCRACFAEVDAARTKKPKLG